MLVRSQSEGTLMDFGNLPQPSLEVIARFVLDPAIFNKHREVVFTVLPSGPTKIVHISVEKVWSSRRESVTKTLLNFCLEDRQPHAIYSVLQSCILVEREKTH